MWRNRTSEKNDGGGSLLETALVMPLLLVMVLFAADFGYFFLVTTSMVTAARNAALYSTQGFDSLSQQQIPTAGTSGSMGDTSGVAGVVGSDMSGLSATLTGTPNPQVQVCSKSVGPVVAITNSSGGTTGYRTACATYPSGTLSYTPDTDPESLSGLLTQRVDVVYTVKPPVTLRFFTFNTVPPLTFHWQVEMRAID